MNVSSGNLNVGGNVTTTGIITGAKGTFNNIVEPFGLEVTANTNVRTTTKWNTDAHAMMNQLVATEYRLIFENTNAYAIKTVALANIVLGAPSGAITLSTLGNAGDLVILRDITAGRNLIATTQVTTPVVRSTGTLSLEAGIGGVFSATIQGDTTASPANMVMGGATPQILTSTSTRKGKIDVSFLDSLTSNKITDLKPRVFLSNTSVNKYDNPNKEFTGLYAEEVFEVFPQCVMLKNESYKVDVVRNYTYYYQDDNNKTVEIVEYYNETETRYTGIQHPYSLDWNCLNTITIKEVQDLREENQMLKDELCLKDNTYSWC